MLLCFLSLITKGAFHLSGLPGKTGRSENAVYQVFEMAHSESNVRHFEAI